MGPRFEPSRGSILERESPLANRSKGFLYVGVRLPSTLRSVVNSGLSFIFFIFSPPLFHHLFRELTQANVILVFPKAYDKLSAMKKKLYLETTVPSYLAARPSSDLIVAGHQQITRHWWERRKNDFEVYISQFVVDEAGSGDKEAAQRRLEIIEEFGLLDITGEVTDLAEAIIKKGALPAKSATDAAHIAVASVHSMDFLMTWNCAHIANAEIFFAVSDVCKSQGFECPIICTPEELIGE